jgi:uncharacterized membrane protein YfcA
VHEILIAVVGGVVGLVFGALGAGPAIATPALALVGVPPLAAVASPLPGLLPSALAGARQYRRSGHLDRRAALVAVVVGVPAVVLGALASGVVGGSALLALSALLLLVAGVRMGLPVARPVVPSVAPPGGAPDAAPDAAPVAAPDAAPVVAEERTVVPSGTGTRRLAVVGVLVAGAAFLSGLLANGGGSLLVPIFVVGLGLGATRAAGTSMLAVAAMLVPTLAVHWELGHIDWTVAAAFACGVIPATLLGTRVGRRLDDAVARRLLGALLVTFALVFAATRLL